MWSPLLYRLQLFIDLVKSWYCLAAPAVAVAKVIAELVEGANCQPPLLLALKQKLLYQDIFGYEWGAAVVWNSSGSRVSVWCVWSSLRGLLKGTKAGVDISEGMITTGA